MNCAEGAKNNSTYLKGAGVEIDFRTGALESDYNMLERCLSLKFI